MLRLLPYLANPVFMTFVVVSFLMLCMLAYLFFLKSIKDKPVDPDRSEIQINDIFLRTKHKKPRRDGRV